jgi:hypothetical protein
MLDDLGVRDGRAGQPTEAARRRVPGLAVCSLAGRVRAVDVQRRGRAEETVERGETALALLLNEAAS